MKFLIIFCGLIATAVAQSSNYCAAKICSNGAKHIGCGHNGAFASTCPAGARIVNLSADIKNSIVHEHNRRRNQIAGGSLSGYQSARRMGTIRWDNELAYLAGLNVRQCVMRHDACRNTERFKMSGQNLAYFGYSGAENSRSFTTIINDRIASWWNEYTKANMGFINKYPNGYSGPAIGHFTVMAAEKNIALGCACARYKSGSMNTVLFACNYATTNIINQPIYVAGATASGCTTGRNPTYQNLCSTAEVFQNL